MRKSLEMSVLVSFLILPFSYVYPGTFGVVYLCNAFWNAPVAGTDSRGGTLIHESSHFTANGGTQDIVYGTNFPHSYPK